MLTSDGSVPLQGNNRPSYQMDPMKRALLFILLSACFFARAGAQQVDSIFFNLYTDSLKKGTHNYINIDGKLNNGRWMPLTGKEIEFTASSCEFSGNELIVPAGFTEEKIKVKAVLKSNPSVWKERTIWIKKLPDPDTLPTNEEILRNKPVKKRN